MGDIIAVYNQKRMDFKDNPKGVLDETLNEQQWQQSDLEHLASHLANCISNGLYQQRESIYPFIDLESMVQLKREKRIVKPDATLQAVYHLLDDYFLPEKQQHYRLNSYQIVEVIQAAIDLGLAKDFDIAYIEKSIQQAERGKYSNLLEGRRVVSALVDKKIEIDRAKTKN